MNCIKLIREKKEMTLAQLAREAYVSAPYLLDLERNARGAKPETMERIAAALGVSVEELTSKKNDNTDRESA